MTDKQEFIDILETVYRGARKGRGLVVSPKGVCPCRACAAPAGAAPALTLLLGADYSTKYRY